jgi:hypothetical protein
LALLLRRQYEFPQCGINKGIFFLNYAFVVAIWLCLKLDSTSTTIVHSKPQND